MGVFGKIAREFALNTRYKVALISTFVLAVLLGLSPRPMSNGRECLTAALAVFIVAAAQVGFLHHWMERREQLRCEAAGEPYLGLGVGWLVLIQSLHLALLGGLVTYAAWRGVF
jgi:hypothetical protein